MIINLRHRGLRILYEKGTTRYLNPNEIPRLRRILTLLDSAEEPKALDLPGLRLHPLKGDLKGFWAISVSANWRIIFRFENNDVHDVDLIDYH